VLAVLGIERHFEHLFDIRFFGFQPKPELSGYQRALDVLGVSGDQALLIEDTPKNLPPARSLGMTTILIGEPDDNGSALVADYRAPDILAALRIVLELEAVEKVMM
jgi:putative hydrolase of the HAD superfamily